MKTGKQLGNEPFSPIWCDDGKWEPALGITIREYFVGLAMQGLLSNPMDNDNCDDIANYAVRCADALLEELSKTE